MKYIRFLKPPKIDINDDDDGGGTARLETVITITSDLGETFLAEDVDVTASLMPIRCLQNGSRKRRKARDDSKNDDDDGSGDGSYSGSSNSNGISKNGKIRNGLKDGRLANDRRRFPSKTFRWTYGMRALKVTWTMRREEHEGIWPAALVVEWSRDAKASSRDEGRGKKRKFGMEDSIAKREGMRPWSLRPIVAATSAVLYVSTTASTPAITTSSISQRTKASAIKKNIRSSTAERFVRRQFECPDGESFGLWEETGESIARHVWDAGMALSAHLKDIVAWCLEDGEGEEKEKNAIPLIRNLIRRSIPRDPNDGITTPPETSDINTTNRLNILELGCGIGVVGINLARTITCDVTLTDLPEAAAIAKKNIAASSSLAFTTTPTTPDNDKTTITTTKSTISFLPLPWDDAPLPPSILLPSSPNDINIDLVVLSDCTYNPDTTPHLVRTLTSLQRLHPAVVVLVGMKVRHADEVVFFELMARAGFVERGHVVLGLPFACCEKGEVEGEGEEEGGEEEEVVHVYAFTGREGGSVDE